MFDNLIKAGVAGIHFEDQSPTAKRCGHLGGKVVVSTQEALQKLKDHLDEFLEETIRIEKAQMKTEDPAELSAYLDEVTSIKLEALEQLSHEDLRGDRTFLIFLTQCANLIAKIQRKLEATRKV